MAPKRTVQPCSALSLKRTFSPEGPTEAHSVLRRLHGHKPSVLGLDPVFTQSFTCGKTWLISGNPGSKTPPGTWARGHDGTSHEPPANSCSHSVRRGGAGQPLRATEGCRAQVSPTGLFQVLAPYPASCALQCRHGGCGRPLVGEICSHLQSEPTLPALAFLLLWIYKCQRHK